jgi:hypothetical protein
MPRTAVPESAALPRRPAPPDLRSAIGNRAMARLLLRDALQDEIIRDVGPVADPKQWSKQRDGDIRPQFTELAKLAKAGRLRDVKVDQINTAMDAKRGERDIKPGLNFVGKLTGKGECGFVDGQGVFRGPQLPVSLDGPLPRIAIMLGPQAFHQGKDGALGTLRHEMKHAEHFQMMIDWLGKWRDEAKKSGMTKLDDDGARKRFDAWVDRNKGIGKVDHALLFGERGANHHNTELLAYVEGFINIWHLRTDAPSVELAATYPPALYQLRRAGEEFQYADSAVKAAALDRLRDYITSVLTARERISLRVWLTFLADQAKAPAGTDGRSKLLHNDWKPLAGWLKEVGGLVP